MSDVINNILNQHDKVSNTGNSGNQNKSKENDLSIYYNIFLKDGENEKQDTIRILPNPEGGTPFKEVYFHTFYTKQNGNRKFACPNKNWGRECPFCEAAKELKSNPDNEKEKNLAKKYEPRLYYVVKVVDRSEEDKVKFFRFPHNFKGEGVFDKIVGIIKAKSADITDVDNGRDLTINITRNEQGYPTVTSIVDHDPSPLHADENKKQQFLSENQEKDWTDAWKTYNYEYLTIIVKGGTPVWDKNQNQYVDKEKRDNVKSENHSSEEDDVTLGGSDESASNIPQGDGNASADVNETPASEESNESEGDDLPF